MRTDLLNFDDWCAERGTGYVNYIIEERFEDDTDSKPCEYHFFVSGIGRLCVRSFDTERERKMAMLILEHFIATTSRRGQEYALVIFGYKDCVEFLYHVPTVSKVELWNSLALNERGWVLSNYRDRYPVGLPNGTAYVRMFNVNGQLETRHVGEMLQLLNGIDFFKYEAPGQTKYPWFNDEFSVYFLCDRKRSLGRSWGWSKLRSRNTVEELHRSLPGELFLSKVWCNGDDLLFKWEDGGHNHDEYVTIAQTVKVDGMFIPYKIEVPPMCSAQAIDMVESFLVEVHYAERRGELW